MLVMDVVSEARSAMRVSEVFGTPYVKDVDVSWLPASEMAKRP